MLYLIRNKHNNELVVTHVSDWLWQEGYRIVKELKNTAEHTSMMQNDKDYIANMQYTD